MVERNRRFTSFEQLASAITFPAEGNVVQLHTERTGTNQPQLRALPWGNESAVRILNSGSEALITPITRQQNLPSGVHVRSADFRPGTLDMGIGKGGWYLNSRNGTYVGMDIDKRDLIAAKGRSGRKTNVTVETVAADLLYAQDRLGKWKYMQALDRSREKTHRLSRKQIEGVVADAYELPFQDASFNTIEMHFPHDTLLLGLAHEHFGLWDELRRILSPKGHINLTFDTYAGGYRPLDLYTSEGERIRVTQLKEKIVASGKNAGFDFLELPVDQEWLTYGLGTRYSQWLVDSMKGDRDHLVHNFRASKLPQEAVK